MNSMPGTLSNLPHANQRSMSLYHSSAPRLGMCGEEWSTPPMYAEAHALASGMSHSSTPSHSPMMTPISSPYRYPPSDSILGNVTHPVGTSLLAPRSACQSPARSDTTESSTSTQGQDVLYKTELCRAFLEGRTCQYGDSCRFAHGKSELRRRPHHPKYKTEICKRFHNEGYCPYGKRCCFLHLPHGTEKGRKKSRATPAAEVDDAGFGDGEGQALPPRPSSGARTRAMAFAAGMEAAQYSKVDTRRTYNVFGTDVDGSTANGSAAGGKGGKSCKPPLPTNVHGNWDTPAQPLTVQLLKAEASGLGGGGNASNQQVPVTSVLLNNRRSTGSSYEFAEDPAAPRSQSFCNGQKRTGTHRLPIFGEIAPVPEDGSEGSGGSDGESGRHRALTC